MTDLKSSPLAIQRYEMVWSDYSRSVVLEPIEEGKLVFYTDHLAALAAKDALCERLARALAEFVEEHSSGSFVEAGQEMMEQARAALASYRRWKEGA